MSPPAQDPSSTPPGWYPDPWAPGGVRWWSGTEWTGYRARGAGLAGPAHRRLRGRVAGHLGRRAVPGRHRPRADRQAPHPQGRRARATAAAWPRRASPLGCIFLALTVGVGDAGRERGLRRGERRRLLRRGGAGRRGGRPLRGRVRGRPTARDLPRALHAASWPAVRHGRRLRVGLGERATAGWAEIDIKTLTFTGDSATAIADDEDGDDDWTFTSTRDSARRMADLRRSNDGAPAGLVSRPGTARRPALVGRQAVERAGRRGRPARRVDRPTRTRSLAASRRCWSSRWPRSAWASAPRPNRIPATSWHSGRTRPDEMG